MSGSRSSSTRAVSRSPSMTTAATQRRQPVQERSRQTVARILEAAEALIDEGGVEAVTTRAVADRAGVTYPSLYRFFADREEILDQLVTHHLAALDAHAVAEERTWQITSVRDVIDRELDLHVAYFKAHPSAARLWLSGRSSPAVVAQVRQRAQVLAERLRQALVAATLAPPDTDPRVLLLVVELGDRILDLAFRDGSDPDPMIIELGRTALNSYARDALDVSDE